MKKIYGLILFSLVLVSCGDKPYHKLGEIEYQRGGEECSSMGENHWLFDVQARDSKDSLYMNTLTLQGKLEIHKLQLDTTLDLIRLLENTCKGDSIHLRTNAKVFYESLNGQVPQWLPENEQINVKVWVRDKLTDLQHISYKKTFESHVMAQYIEDNKWNAKRDGSTEIYLERLKQNDGVRGENKKVLVSYVIQTLNGELITRSTDDDPLVYSTEDKSRLKGISYIINNLSVGESARAVVPSSQAFGADGNRKVPGYTPIVIEIEILKALD
ncbi:MAG: hypothetical protein COA58_08140 [Bacteroidetes bacterium]|nr:MAG: hypothetical protein COA58_08140 [Bacteroidota bacterium]